MGRARRDFEESYLEAIRFGFKSSQDMLMKLSREIKRLA